MEEAFGDVPEPRTVRLERVFPGPIERVWAYLTESEKRGKWLARGEMELRVGGRVELIFNNENLSAGEETPERFKKSHGYVGEVTHCEPPRLISFTWFPGPESKSEVTFELTPKDDKVLFVLTHRRLASRTGMVMVASGWHTHTGVLADILNGAERRPFWKTLLRVEQEYEKRIAP